MKQLLSTRIRDGTALKLAQTMAHIYVSSRPIGGDIDYIDRTGRDASTR